MKKFNISDVKATEVLSINEKRNIVGGARESANSGILCVMCYSNSGESSCWYTSGDPGSACSGIYPEGANFNVIDCRKLDCGTTDI